VLTAASTFLAQLLWPARCAGCDGVVPPLDAFCEDCAAAMLPLPPGCPTCGESGAPGVACARCRASPPPIDRTHGAFTYGGPAREALLRLKHGHRTDLARPLGGLLAVSLHAAVEDGCDFLLPVPLHPRRLRSRGFNQALLLLRSARAALVRNGPAPPILVDALRRLVDTPALGHLAPDERRATVSGAFAVHPPFHGRLEGRRVVLVDDVMTSGATVMACALALRAAGASGVKVAVLARALGADRVSVLDTYGAGTNVRGPNLKRTGT
jgi:ComF family protein